MPPRAAQTAFFGQNPLPQPAQPAQPCFKTQNVYVLLEGAAAYETFIRTLNEVIKKYSVKPHKHKHGTGE